MEARHGATAGWSAAREPTGEELERELESLVTALGAAAGAAREVAGADPLGVRAIEITGGRTRYLCAFDGPAFLCLSEDLAVMRELRAVREAATAGLVWEHVEALVDVDRLRELSEAAGRVLAIAVEPPAMVSAIASVAEGGRRLAEWRASPLRALASMPQVDVASTLQDRLHRAYVAFVGATDHLVEIQDRLAPELVAALRAFEEAAGRAGVGERLADGMALIVPSCDEAAEEVLAAHLVPLAP